MRRVSRTDIPLNSAMFWKVRAIPRRARAAGGLWVMSCPSKEMEPFWGEYRPLMQFSMLVFPAPFGPMIEKISPLRTEKPRPPRAMTPPNRRLMFSTASWTGLSVELVMYYPEQFFLVVGGG